MDQKLVLNLNQAAIDGIRASGAKTQYIFIEGNSYTGAWKWTSENDNLKTLTDPQDKLVYQMHQYLDSDGSGTSADCVSETIGKERLQSATQWLKRNEKKGFLGEFAGGVNQQCQTAVKGMLEFMEANSEVWMGAEWWAAGPWWGDYMYNLEPTDGGAYETYLPILEKYFVHGDGSASASASVSPSASASVSVSPSSSPSSSSIYSSRSQVIRTPVSPVSSSSSQAPSSGSGSGSGSATIPVYVPTTFATAASSSATPGSSSGSVSASASASSSASGPAASSSAAGGTARKYEQCGGESWTGATACESGSSCVKQNSFYSQCQ